MSIEHKRPAEVIAVLFPYADEIGAATITGVVISIAVIKGADPAVAAMLQGAAQIAGSEVRQLVKNGVAGVRYRAVCLASMNDGRALEREYIFEVPA